MIVDTLPNWEKYFASNVTAPGSPWRVAFEYLSALRPDSEECGMTPLLGDQVMARVMSYPTAPADEKVLEAHDRYVDIQMSLVGSEGIGWYPREGLAVSTPYDPETDAVFFECPENAVVQVNNVPGLFAVLFPQDAHMPGLHAADGAGTVKKVVVKILLEAIARS